ncbi:MAG: ATP-binding protein [Bacteroidetes bacterium]|nr:ATP-binding protein [Bacteroidota bacterium]
MISRSSQKELLYLLKHFPAVSVLGSRQVGKTTLVKEIAKKLGKKAVYFDLEKASDRAKFYDIHALLSPLSDKCVIIDEAQELPELFTALRPLIDEKRTAGRFVLLGSASPHIIKGISESLAGRIAHLEIGPINFREAQSKNITYKKLWFRGGYPQALLAKTDILWHYWAENYYRSFIERDVNFLMKESLSPTIVKNLWKMLSGINGNILNHDDLARSLGLSRPTIYKYLDFMEGAFLIRRLQPWFINVSKRIVKSPKLYFRDNGVLHYLNGIHSANDLAGSIHSGASWESFVVEQITQLKHPFIEAYYYRTHHGAEADLILVKGTTPVVCIEIKLSNAPEIKKGWYEVKKDLKTKKNFIITPQSDEYRVSDDTIVCSLQRFLEKHLKEIK